ncbi:MAG: cell division protein SepF [Promethearchaeota archaeon]
MKFWKKEYEDILGDGSPHETLGFTKERNYLQIPAMIQKFLIKKFDFNSIEQIGEIKKQLSRRKILIINARELLNNDTIPIQALKSCIDEIKTFLEERGGSIGRIGDQYLILTPSPHVKIANYY